MKILFWTEGFWPLIGGIETQALHFLTRLVERGHQVFVIANQKEGLLSSEKHNGISIRRFPFDLLGRKEIRVLKEVESYLAECGPFDLLHMNTGPGWAAFTLRLFLNKFSIPTLLTLHTPYYESGVMDPLTRTLIEKAQRVACVSNWVLEEAKKQIPEQAHKFCRIYNGLKAPAMISEKIDWTAPRFLMSGRLSSEKGYDTGIIAFSKLGTTSAKLTILGDGAEKPYLKSLSPHVEWVGSVDVSEVPLWMSRAAVVVIPSYFESFGLVAVEAMQMERAVIATNVGGLPEVVEHEKTGLLVPPKDPEALSRAMRFLLDNPRLAEEMGKKGKEVSMKRFTLEENVAQYEALYQELTS